MGAEGKSKGGKTSSLQKRDGEKPPALRFTPYAWAKLLYLRDRDDSEVGGLAVTSAEDLLLVNDIRLVLQYCTPASVRFDDHSVADLFDEQVDAGLRPAQFARIWVHTHPGRSARPSRTDAKTWLRCFGRTDWSVMFILARGGQTYARLRFGVGPGGSFPIPAEVDFSYPFPAADFDAWEREYRRYVRTEAPPLGRPQRRVPSEWNVDLFREVAGGCGDLGDNRSSESPFLYQYHEREDCGPSF